MRESEFVDPNGRFEKNRKGQVTFVPEFLPPKIDYASMLDLIAEAHMQIGILEGVGKLLPDPDLLIRPYIIQEAVLSSRIEGTEASNLDVYRFEAGGAAASSESKRVLEVSNHVRASRSCLKMIEDGEPVSLEMLKHAHGVLQKGVRGQVTEPGSIRKIQNWIGYANSNIGDALYVPPAAHLLDGLLSDLQSFAKDPPKEIPVLVRCALLHYQFEAIHPFEDGNGRVGRLLISLILAGSGTLSKPLLYLSAYFERNRTEYYDLLRRVSRNNEWPEWIRFFLTGVVQCSKEAIDVTHRFLALRSKYEKNLKEYRASGNAIALTMWLFSNPVVTIPTAAKYLKVGYPPAKKAVMYLVGAGILEQSDDRKRNKEYIARGIMDVFSQVSIRSESAPRSSDPQT